MRTLLDAYGLAIGELLLRSVCAGVFIWAGAVKLNDRNFVRTVSRLSRLGTRASAFVASLLPRIELLIGIGLLVSPAAQAAAVLGLLALSGFTAVLVRELIAGSKEPCSCFGPAEEPVSWRGVGRNALMAVALLPAAVRPPVFAPAFAEGLPWELHAFVVGTAGVLIAVAFTLRTLRASVGQSRQELS